MKHHRTGVANTQDTSPFRIFYATYSHIARSQWLQVRQVAKHHRQLLAAEPSDEALLCAFLIDFMTYSHLYNHNIRVAAKYW